MVCVCVVVMDDGEAKTKKKNRTEWDKGEKGETQTHSSRQ